MSFERMFRIFMAVLALHITTFNSVQAFGKNVQVQKSFEAKSPEERVRSLFEKFPTANHAIFLMSALTKTTEPVHAIVGDLRKNHALGKNAPVITLNKNKILVDGKETGVSVVSYTPFTLAKKGIEWTYDKTASLDKNYFDLKKVLTKSRAHAGKGALLINQAYADIDNDPRELGVAAVIVAGALTLITIPFSLVMEVAIVSTMAIAGVIYDESEKKSATAVETDFKDISKVKVECAYDSVTLESGKSKISAKKDSDEPGDYTFKARSGDSGLDSSFLSESFKNTMVSLSDACREKSTKDVNEALQQANKKLKIELTEDGSAKKSDPTKDTTSQAK